MAENSENLRQRSNYNVRQIIWFRLFLKECCGKFFFFLIFFSIFSFSAKSFVLTSVSPHWEQQAQNAQIPTGHNPVGIKYRSLWDMSSQEQEELC